MMNFVRTPVAMDTVLFTLVSMVALSVVSEAKVTPCKRYQLTKLDCRRRNLNYIPNISDDITLTDLSYNEIGMLTSPFSSKHHLQTLDLSFNKLENIPSNYFSHLTTLQFLHITDNKINTLYSDSFGGLQSLLDLDLSNNDLTLLPHDMLSDLVNLTSLKLSGNILITMPTANLSPLRSLPVNTLNVEFDSLSPFTLTSGLEDFYRFTNLSNLTVMIRTIPKDIAEVTDMIDYSLKLPIKRITITWGETVLFTKQDYITFGKQKTSISDCCQAATKPKLLNSTIELIFNGWKQWTTLGSLTTNSLRPLSRYQQLTSLTLRNAEILDIAEDHTPFTWFPYLRKLDLSYNSLQYLPDSAFNGSITLEELSLAHNQLDIPFIESSLRGLSCLKVINMSANYFLFIPSQAFTSLASCGSLQTLDLSHNDLMFNFPDDGFISTPHLSHLNLNSNKAIQITDWINPLKNLKELYLRDIKHIEIYPSKWRTSLVSMTTLDMSVIQNVWFESPVSLAKLMPNLKKANFHMTNIPLDFIQNLTNLQKVDFSSSQISTKDLSDSWLQLNIPRLEKLNLSSNNITSIPHNVFANTPHLTHLNLSYNQVATIKNDTFLLLHHLTMLDLEGNDLTSVGNFKFGQSLQAFFIANNQISVFQKTLFNPHSNQSNLNSLSLAGNPFQCTCSIEPLLKWIQTNDVVFLDIFNGYVCAEPNKTKDMSIFQVDLVCESHLLLYLGVSFLVFVTVTITGVLFSKYRWHLKYKWFLFIHRRPYIDEMETCDNIPANRNVVKYDA